MLDQLIACGGALRALRYRGHSQPLRQRPRPMVLRAFLEALASAGTYVMNRLPIGLYRVVEVSGSPLCLIGRFNEGRAEYSIERHCYRALSRPEVRVHPSRYHDICVMLRLESFFDGIRYHASEFEMRFGGLLDSSVNAHAPPGPLGGCSFIVAKKMR